MVAGSGISRYGPVTTSGWIMYDEDFVRRRGNRGRTLPAERFLSSEKILVVRTRNLALTRRIVATIDASGSYNLNRLSNIIAREGYSLHGLLGILNSALFNWMYSTRFYDYEVKPFYLRRSPLADGNDTNLVSLVRQMLEMMNRQSSGRLTPSESDRIERQIVGCDLEIDNRVYALYEITKAERRLIEGPMSRGSASNGEWC